MTSSDAMTVDKKAGLNRVPSKTQPEKVEVGRVAVAVTPSVDIPDFIPLKRGEYDQPVDGEKWDDKQRRLKLEKETEAIIVARLTPLEQLGLDAGRAAGKVKETCRQLQMYERNVVSYTKKLADEEALLADRLKQLNEAKL